MIRQFENSKKSKHEEVAGFKRFSQPVNWLWSVKSQKGG